MGRFAHRQPATDRATFRHTAYVAIVGTSTRVQTSTFTVRATDARGQQATGTFSITINPALPLAITPQQWAPVTVGSFSNLWIDGSGGVRPYRWAVTAGQLPPGISLIQDNPSGPLVRVGGTPTTAGTFGFTLRLTDATGATVSRTFSVTVS
jgi:Putative Ig domain